MPLDWNAMNLTEGKEKARELLNKCIELLNTFIEAFKLLPGKIVFIADRFLGHFPAEKRRIILFAFGGSVALLLILVISTVVIHSGRPKKSAAVEVSAGPLLNIPPEDLFIPAEPDFLPGFLLEREPRHSWSIEDIHPYWKKPEGNPDLWREKIKSAVDKLMEDVP